MRHRFAFILTALGSLLLGLVGADTVYANPTGREPNRPLAAHGTIAEAKGMVASLYKIYDEEEQLVIKNEERRDNPARWSDRQIGNSAARLWKARRDVEHLKLMGEPAAIDLEKKLMLLAREVNGFGLAYRGTPKGSQLVQRIQTKLRREAPKMTRFLEQADDALQAGRLEIFEKQMEAKGEELERQLVFFSPVARKPYNAQFLSVLGQGDVLLSKKRKQAYMEIAKEAMQQQVAAASQFSTEATRIAGEIAAGGSAKLSEEQSGDAAEAFAHVVNLWGAASAGLIRAGAIQWAFTDRAATQVQPDPRQLKEMALSSLASIVEAAAASAPPDQVQPLYSELLKQISAADRRIGSFSDEVFQACQTALGKLAAKDPALTGRIERYDRATSEALRWRREFAYQQKQNLQKQFPLAKTLLTAQGEVKSSIRPNFAVNPRKGVVAPSVFTAPANWMVHETASQLVGRPVSEDGMLRLSPTSRTAIVPHDSLHFGNVPVPIPSEPEVGDLMAALVVDEQHGPLTRDSADAVSAALSHDYLAVAGRIERVHLESVVTRFVALPDVAYVLAPLGKMPELSETVTPLYSTCWRLDLRPMWAQHRYFTVRLASQ